MAERRVIVRYHCEDGSWWAESQDLPELFAGGDTLEDAQKMVRQVVDAEFGPQTVIFSIMPVPEPLIPIVSEGGDPEPAEASWSGGGTPDLVQVLGPPTTPELATTHN